MTQSKGYLSLQLPTLPARKLKVKKMNKDYGTFLTLLLTSILLRGRPYLFERPIPAPDPSYVWLPFLGVVRLSVFVRSPSA